MDEVTKKRIEDLDKHVEELKKSLLPNKHPPDWEIHQEREKLLDELQDKLGKIRHIVENTLYYTEYKDDPQIWLSLKRILKLIDEGSSE